MDDLSYWFNHSCEPNAGVRGLSELFAIRPIQEGEEITYDYSTTVGIDRPGSWLLANGDWKMKCNCHSENCRGDIGTFTTIPQNTFERYIALGALPDFIKAQVLITRKI